jgi:hypothetical protein
MSGTGAAGFMGGTPKLTQTTNRTHCEACGGRVYPTMRHWCGNERIETEPGAVATEGASPDERGLRSTIIRARTHCEACGERVEPNVFHKCAGQS